MTDSEIQDPMPHVSGITSWRESADKCLLDLLPQKLTSRAARKGKETSTRRLELAIGIGNQSSIPGF